MYTGTNNIHHAAKHKNLLFKNNNSNHDNTKTDKEQKQKLNSSTESKIYALTTTYAPEFITMVIRFTPVLRDLRTIPCTG